MSRERIRDRPQPIAGLSALAAIRLNVTQRSDQRCSVAFQQISGFVDRK
jgi:hypothetical protein